MPNAIDIGIRNFSGVTCPYVDSMEIVQDFRVDTAGVVVSIPVGGWVVGSNIGVFTSPLGQEAWAFVDTGLGTIFSAPLATRGRHVFAAFGTGATTLGGAARESGSRERGRPGNTRSRGTRGDSPRASTRRASPRTGGRRASGSFT